MSTPQPGRLVGKVVLITGAAQGIGKASVLVSSLPSAMVCASLTNLLQRCKEEGAKVVATDINVDELHKLQQEHADLLVARLDVTSKTDVEAVLAEHSDINVLFNCAGYAYENNCIGVIIIQYLWKGWESVGYSIIITGKSL